MASTMSRRQMMWGAGGFASLMLVGYSVGGSGTAAALAQAGPKAAPLPKLTMYRSPGCGCCLKWVERAREAGFEVSVVNSPDIVAVKKKAGVPEELYSCHTSIAAGYVIEGHVPFDAVKRLLRTRPKIRGIAVPGMPAGSPGMEVPSGDKEPFQVMAFDAAGKISAFS